MASKYELVRTADPVVLKAHSQTRWLPSILTVVLMYAGIWLTAWVTMKVGWPLWLPALLIIAAFQNHFSILMHEAAHFLLLPSRVWNDRLGQALFAAPIVMLLKDYRYIHLQHHKYSGDPERDPEVGFYHGAEIGYGASGDRVRKNLVNDLTGVSTLKSLKHLNAFIQSKVKAGDIRPANLADLCWTMGGWLVLLLPAKLMGFGWTLTILWLVAYLTVTPVLIRWHGVGEHTGVNAETEQEKTLTHDFPFVVDFFLYPLRSGWHLEHHLFPQVPWYQMKSFRNILLSNSHYKTEAQKLTVDGFWWGKRTVKDVVLKR
jgi:fatty acid desaturase